MSEEYLIFRGGKKKVERVCAFILTDKRKWFSAVCLDLLTDCCHNNLDFGRFGATSFGLFFILTCLCVVGVSSVSSRMVKVSFNTALAQKDVKKDAETLIPEEDKVSRKWLSELNVIRALNSARRS